MVSLARALSSSSARDPRACFKAAPVDNGAPSSVAESGSVYPKCMKDLWLVSCESLAISSHFSLLKVRPRSAHSSSRVSMSYYYYYYYYYYYDHHHHHRRRRHHHHHQTAFITRRNKKNPAQKERKV